MLAAQIRRTLPILVAAVLPAAAHAQTIDFDGYPTSGYEQLGTYAGMNWTNTFVLQAGTSFAPVAAVSSPNVIFPGFGGVSGFALATPGTFTLGSIDFTQWDPFYYGTSAPSTTVRGYVNGALVASDVMTVALGPSYQTTVFNWAGIDAVTFTQEAGAGWYIADNVVIGDVATTATPEPTPITLFATGLVTLGAAVRRRRT